MGSLFSKDIGIDLGTANTLIFEHGKGIVLREPSIVALDTRTDVVRFVGFDAKEVVGRTPGSIIAVRPLKDGVIADFDVASSMLQLFIKKVCKSTFLSRPRVVICIPSGVTAVERRAVREATLKAGARQVAIIEEPMAAAIGADLPVAAPHGNMVLDIGGGTSEVAVISLGGIVASKSVRVAGDEFDNDIIDYLKTNFKLAVGERTAEEIKIKIGSAYPYENEEPMSVKGRNLIDGLPKSISITPEQVREALSSSVRQILNAVHDTLEQTPPELSADIIESGITLTGGGSMLKGLDILLNKETGIPVYIAENPLDCVAVGSGRVLESLSQMRFLLSDE